MKALLFSHNSTHLQFNLLAAPVRSLLSVIATERIGSAHLWHGRILFTGGDSGKAGANAANATITCAASTDAVKRCQFVCANTSDWIVTISGDARSDYQLEIAFDGQAIPATQKPVTTNVPVDVSDTLVDGVTTQGADARGGASSVVVGGGSVGVSSLFTLFIFFAVRFIKRYGYVRIAILRIL